MQLFRNGLIFSILAISGPNAVSAGPSAVGAKCVAHTTLEFPPGLTVSSHHKVSSLYLGEERVRCGTVAFTDVGHVVMIAAKSTDFFFPRGGADVKDKPHQSGALGRCAAREFWEEAGGVLADIHGLIVCNNVNFWVVGKGRPGPPKDKELLERLPPKAVPIREAFAILQSGRKKYDDMRQALEAAIEFKKQAANQRAANQEAATPS